MVVLKEYLTINSDGTFTHSYCNGDEVGDSWTSDGNTIDITSYFVVKTIMDMVIILIHL